jgi:hypothetical protein
MNLRLKIDKSKVKRSNYTKYLNDWKLAENIDEAKKLVLSDPAIEKNADNTNKNVFEDYVRRVMDALNDFLENRESFFFSNIYWLCVF